MRNGDMVVVTDGSYIQEITPNGLKSVSINQGEAKGLRHQVVSTGCKFPNECDYQLSGHKSNTIICGTEGCVEGRFFVVYNKFLRLAQQKHRLVIDGKAIMISDESYQALKKSLL